MISKIAFVGMVSLLLGGNTVLLAQTDYYNTDLGRPIQIEDAYPTERYAFELQIAPLRVERTDPGAYNWGIEPEVAYGLLPRTHVEIGFPLSFSDKEASGLTGVDVSVLHNLNTETTSLPALGLAAHVTLPMGRLAPDKTSFSVKALATRTYRWARFHLNGQYTLGDEVQGGAGGEVTQSRWLAGVAIDRTFPLRALLVTAEFYAREPLVRDADVEYNAGGGIRYQLSPRWSMDAGVGRRLNGNDQGWFVTFGTAYAFSLRSLIGVPRQ